MASKSRYRANEKGAEISELLETTERLLDRTKVLYEQYFMGIQKVAPAQLHRDIERKIRQLTQMQIRNTALRYRLTTVTQKFGAYNTYWRRTLRQIEQGKYVRDLARVRRKAMRRGEDIPEELVAAMPKRMRERIRRDREMLAKKREREQGARDDDEMFAEGDLTEEHEMPHEMPHESAHESAPGIVRKPRSPVHHIDGEMFEEDLDALFDQLTTSAEAAINRREQSSTERAKQPAATPARQPGPRRSDARLREGQPGVPRGATPGRARPPLPADGPVPGGRDPNTSSRPGIPLPSSGPLRQPRHFTPRPEIRIDGKQPTPSTPPGDGRTRPGWSSPPAPSGKRPPPTPPPRPRSSFGADDSQSVRGETKVQWKINQDNPRRATTAGPRIGRRPPPQPPTRSQTPGPARAKTPPPTRSNTPASARSGTPPPRPSAPARPPSGGSGAGGMSEKQTRAIYNRYVQARKMLGASGDVPYERMVKTLNNQASRIMEQHKAKAVDFKVVIKNDKVILKAKPKR